MQEAWCLLLFATESGESFQIQQKPEAHQPESPQKCTQKRRKKDRKKFKLGIDKLNIAML